MDRSIIVYNGTNGSEMKGFYRGTNTNGRLQFLGLPNVNPYLAPVSTSEMEEYKSHGYVLQQTEGWPQD